jgi:hypothetical protein
MTAPIALVATSQVFNFFQDIPSLSELIKKIIETVKKTLRSFKGYFTVFKEKKPPQETLFYLIKPESKSL